MHEHLYGVYREVCEHASKRGHWVWWVFPTDRPGGSEPYEAKSFVPPEDREAFLRKAPVMWRVVLEKIVSKPGFVDNPQDFGRMAGFIRFWRPVAREGHWLAKVLHSLEEQYAYHPLFRRAMLRK